MSGTLISWKSFSKILILKDCKIWFINLKILISFFAQNPNQNQKELIDQAATQLAQDNTELASAIIQKSAVEKALPEMDRRLSTVS